MAVITALIGRMSTPVELKKPFSAPRRRASRHICLSNRTRHRRPKCWFFRRRAITLASCRAASEILARFSSWLCATSSISGSDGQGALCRSRRCHRIPDEVITSFLVPGLARRRVTAVWSERSRIRTEWTSLRVDTLFTCRTTVRLYQTIGDAIKLAILSQYSFHAKKTVLHIDLYFCTICKGVANETLNWFI